MTDQPPKWENVPVYSEYDEFYYDEDSYTKDSAIKREEWFIQKLDECFDISDFENLVEQMRKSR